MQINSLELENFRNYECIKVEFNENVNVICGENGQGKTNILESIYMCGTGKSHKGSKEKEMIRNGCENAHIKGEFCGKYVNRRVDIHLKAHGGKGIAVDRIPIKKVSELYGRIPVVMFSAEDLDIIKRGPSGRRRFLDIELCQIDPIYVENLINYNHILEQRRELFKNLEEKNEDVHALSDVLDILDMQLTETGCRLIKRRRAFIEELSLQTEEIHKKISGGKEMVQLVYEPSVGEEEFYEKLLRAREKDSILKQTSVGPHRDDFSFMDGKTDLKTYGSNGQQRTAAVSLKLAQIMLIENKKKECPLLLLDDVLSELDRSRQKVLLENFEKTQTIITCTGINEFLEKELGKVRMIRIENGSCEIK